MLEGSYTFYTDADPVQKVGPGTFILIPPGAVHGFRTGPQGGKLIYLWPSAVEVAFFNDRMDVDSRKAMPLNDTLGVVTEGLTLHDREPEDPHLPRRGAKPPVR